MSIMKAGISREDNVFGLIGDPLNRLIFEILAVGDCSTADIAKASGAIPALVQRRLQIFQAVQLVQKVPNSRERTALYRLTPGGFLPLMEWVARFDVR